MEKKPLKRAAGLKPFSIDHHQGLLLCWKIRTGIKKLIAAERIAAYVQWFYNNELLPHFKLEENYIFPILGTDNVLIKRAIEEHKLLNEIVKAETADSLLQLADVLEQHIRFEERILFEEIQLRATIQELEYIATIHGNNKFIENKKDEFWLPKPSP